MNIVKVLKPAYNKGRVICISRTYAQAILVSIYLIGDTCVLLRTFETLHEIIELLDWYNYFQKVKPSFEALMKIFLTANV